MKKLLAVIMSVVMMFTLAALPVAAADAQEEDTITMEEVVDTVELTIALIKDTIEQVHFIVGSILGVLEKECPLCGEIHVWESTDDEIVEDDEIVDDGEEAPATPEDAELAA